MNFYSMNICNFRTQCRVDLAQNANRGYWRHFKFLRVVFVSLLILPHALFRRGPVFVLQIIKLFWHSTSYFFKLDKFENNFWIFEGRFCSGNVPVSLGNRENVIYPKCVWQGHQRDARTDQVARTDHVGHPRACSENNINMVSVFTLMNIFDIN